MDAQRSPEDRVTQNEIICEKLLGWVKRPSDIPGISFSGWCVPNGPDESTPSFGTWAEAGLILDALQSMAGWESARACSQFGWLLKTRELTPLAIRAEALEYIRRQA
jgi:hypothetical protein